MLIYKLPDDIDKKIYPLVESLNQTGYIRTTGSCAGYTPLPDGTYKRHRLAKDALPWLAFEPNGDALKCSQLLEYVSKRLANAHQWGFSPLEPNSATLSPDARESFEFYQQVGAEKLFWLDKPIFHIEWQLVIQPILKEGEIESLRRYGIEKPFGVVRTKEDIRKIYQLVEMAAREFEYGDTIEVPALPTLEEQFQSMKEFLLSLPYFYVGPTDRRKLLLADRTSQICMKGQPIMNGAIYVVGRNVGGAIGYGDVGDFSAYTQVAELLTHIAIRLHNNYAQQMSFCTNVVNLHQIPKVEKPHRFYEEADAISLFGSPLPLLVIYEGFEFLVAELEYATLWQTDTPIRVLAPQDVMKVWQLFEIAVRDFIETNKIHEAKGGDTDEKAVFTK